MDHGTVARQQQEGLSFSRNSNKNETPLHMAVHKRRLDTITLLLGNGADFTIKSKDDETALDIANKNDILGLILVLLSEYHQQQSTIDKGGNHSFSHQPPFANFLSSNPNATKLKNNDGNLPLHLAINGKSSFETIQFILSSYPEALKIKNNEGNLPLHLASNGKSSFETIQFILASYPEAIEIKNNEGNLPLHLASNGKLSFETIQFILSSYLEALKIKNNEGNLPDVDNKTFKNSLGDQMLDKQIPIDKSKHQLNYNVIIITIFQYSSSLFIFARLNSVDQSKDAQNAGVNNSNNKELKSRRESKGSNEIATPMITNETDAKSSSNNNVGASVGLSISSL
eukprot:gene6084-8383_t